MRPSALTSVGRMPRASQWPRPVKFALVLAASLSILGGTSFWGLVRMQMSVRQQMINHAGEILYAVAQAQQFFSSEGFNPGSLEQPANQLALVLGISQIQAGVLAVRLFNPAGAFVTAFPPNVTESTMDVESLARLRELQPCSRFHAAAHLEDLFLRPESYTGVQTTPLLEINIPIRARGQSNFLGAAQLLLDARALELELSKLDARLRLQTLMIFLTGGFLLSLVLVVAYRRLHHANCLLRERSAGLLRANHELAMAAKTGALGAVAAHLVHGLSNPLSSLQQLVNAHGGGGADWNEAAAATGRMQRFVYDAVRVMSETNADDRYELTLGELREVLAAKIQAGAQDLGVEVKVQLSGDGGLGNCEANLVLLILENLIRNALEATPKGKEVVVSLEVGESDIACRVTDQGPGFPRYLLSQLFSPCRSSKGSSGIGLAISKQLARHLGGDLTLDRTGPDGCTFLLTLPVTIIKGVAKASGPTGWSAGSLKPLRGVQRVLASLPTLTRVWPWLLVSFLICLNRPTELRAWSLPPKWHWSNPTPHGANVFDQACFAGVYLQVGEGGQVFTSDDLTTWVPRDSHTTGALRGATFFGGRILITGESGTVLFSDDATSFYLVDLGTTDWLEAVAASSSMAVAVGDNGAIYASTNGVAWQRMTVPFSTWLSGVAFGATNTFVAVGETGFIATSQNGANWTVRTTGTTANLNWVKWVGDRFLAVGNGGKVLSSSTGASWQSVSTGATNNLYGVAGGNNWTLVAGESEIRLKGPGATNWISQLSTNLSAPAPPWSYYSALWDGSNFLVAGASGMSVLGLTSATSVAWVSDTNSVGSWLWDVTSFQDRYVAVGNYGSLLTSPEGIDWTVELVPSSATNEVLLGVGGSTNFLLSVGSQGTILWATNALLWNSILPKPTTNDLQGICYDGQQFLVCGGLGTILASPNGGVWTKRTSGVNSFLMSMDVFPGGYVAVGEDGVILTSLTSANWARQASKSTNWLSRVRYLNGILIAVGENGTVLTSSDATNWTARSSGTTAWLNDVASLEGAWFVVGNQGSILASTDLTNWTSIGVLTAKSLYGAVIRGGQFITVGAEGCIIRSQLIPATNAVHINRYSRISGSDIFLLTGQPDQEFYLNNSADFSTWLDGPLLDFYDSSGTLLYLSDSATNSPKRFFRTVLAQ